MAVRRIGVVHARRASPARPRRRRARPTRPARTARFSRPSSPASQRYTHSSNGSSDHFLGVVEHAAELAEDDLLRRQVGDQQQVQGAAVALAGHRRHRLGVDQHQAQQQQRAPARPRRAAVRIWPPASDRIQAGGSQAEQQQVGQADHQHLSTIGPGAHLPPEDRIVPDAAGRGGRRSARRRRRRRRGVPPIGPDRARRPRCSPGDAASTSPPQPRPRATDSSGEPWPPPCRRAAASAAAAVTRNRWTGVASRPDGVDCTAERVAARIARQGLIAAAQSAEEMPARLLPRTPAATISPTASQSTSASTVMARA